MRVGLGEEVGSVSSMLFLGLVRAVGWGPESFAGLYGKDKPEAEPCLGPSHSQVSPSLWEKKGTLLPTWRA